MKKVLYNFRLFDGISGKLQDKKTILINGDRIEKVGELGHMPSKEYKMIDLEGLTLLPGFIDLHVHITVPLISEVKGKADLLAIEKQRKLNLKSCIKYGITTVRDMGAFPSCIQKYIKMIEKGEVVGPRIYTANSFITSKNGPPERAPHMPFPLSWISGGQLAVRTRTPREVRRAAVNNLKKGASFLKTQYAEESMFFQGRLTTLSDECFAELKQIARENHVKVAMHHTENAGFKKGILFEFDSLEHCSLEPLEQSDIEQFVAKHMAIVPTLRVNHSYTEVDEILEWLVKDGKGDYTPECLAQITRNLEAHKRKPYPPDKKHIYLDVEKSRDGFETTRQNVERLKKAGALIGVGSDAFGCYLNLPGFYWKELLLLTQAGLSNFEALQAATLINARILGIERDAGSIEPGKYADFVLIEGNPLEDITSTKNIRTAIKGGIAYKR